MRKTFWTILSGLGWLVLFGIFTACQATEFDRDEDDVVQQGSNMTFGTSTASVEIPLTERLNLTPAAVTPTKTMPPISTEKSHWVHPPTRTPSATPTVTDLPEGCLVSEGPTSTYDLPDPATLDWENIPVSHGQLGQLERLPAPVWDIAPSYDGQWMVMELVHQNFEMGHGDTALYVLEALGDGHWIASESGASSLFRYRWLPDGQLLWVDRYRLFLADSDGHDRRDLAAPEEVYEVWLGADDIALVSGKSGMWRVNYDTGAWDRIENAPHPGNLNVSLDGTYAMAVTFDGEILQYWYLPLSNGGPARLLVEALFYGGHGGRVRPPLPIPNNTFWFTGEWIYFEEREFSDVGMIDAFDGRLVPMHELLDVPDFWTKHYEISPDKRWMSLADQYITSGEVLKEGIFVEDSILGWESDPPGLYIVVNHPEDASWDEIKSVSIEHVALPGGQRTVLVEGLDPSLSPDIYSEDVLYSLDFEYTASVVYAYSMQGEMFASIELPAIGSPPALFTTPTSGLILGLPVQLYDASGESACISQYLWLWDLKS